MRTTTGNLMRRTAAVIALAGLGTLTLGVGPASAETTDTQTVSVDLGDLDNAGSGVFDQFDPSLGTLTAVTIEAEVSMSFDVCITNLSEEGSGAPGGSATGEAVLTFAGGVVATANGAMAVPPALLDPTDGGDDCDVFADTGVAPSSDDSNLTSQSGVVDTFSQTLSAPDQLALYTGTGTVGFDWAPLSTSNINQPTEWTIVFLASGAGEASITYEYTPAENPPQPPPPIPPENPPENPPAPPAPENASTAPGVLPNTGGPNEWLVALAGLLLLAGGGLIALRRSGHEVS